MFKIDNFERKVRYRLKELGPQSKIYLKKNYSYEIFDRHNIRDEEVDYLFDVRKIMRIYPHISFSDRICAEINADKNRKIEIIFQFDPKVGDKNLRGKVGIITAFPL